MALYLNERFNFSVDIEKIKIAGILHDYAKEMSFEDSIHYLEKYLIKYNRTKERFNARRSAKTDKRKKI